MTKLSIDNPSDTQGYFRNKQIEEEKEFWKKEYDRLQWQIQFLFDALDSGEECILASMSGEIMTIKKVDNEQS